MGNKCLSHRCLETKCPYADAFLWILGILSVNLEDTYMSQKQESLRLLNREI